MITIRNTAFGNLGHSVDHPVWWQHLLYDWRGDPVDLDLIVDPPTCLGHCFLTIGSCFLFSSAPHCHCFVLERVVAYRCCITPRDSRQSIRPRNCRLPNDLFPTSVLGILTRRHSHCAICPGTFRVRPSPSGPLQPSAMVHVFNGMGSGSNKVRHCPNPHRPIKLYR